MATQADRDSILANEQRIKNQKATVQQLHKQLKAYNDAFRHYLAAQKIFYDTLDNLCESSWDLKADFSKSLQALGNIAENGARSLETAPVEETIVFRDQFAPYEKEIQDYKEKKKIADAAEKKQIAYSKKKMPDVDELRKLELMAHEKKTSLGISRRKLMDELPTFYKSRMDYYSALWRSIFQIRADVARAECETFDQLTELVRKFDNSRSRQEYGPNQTAVSHGLCYQPNAYEPAYSVASPEVAAMDPPNLQGESATSAGADQQQLNGQQQPPQSSSSSSVSLRRVPTFGGNDENEDGATSSRPVVVRRNCGGIDEN